MTLTRPRRVIALLGVAALGLLGPATADACAGFFSRVQFRSPPELRPSLSREKVLLIYDAASERQHFIREVAFRRASESLGFVVPTPTRPEVAAVEPTPFTDLRRLFSFSPPLPRGRGTKAVDGAPAVEVLEQTQVGSFTAFVLAANDADALRDWLENNRLASDETRDAWLSHYVDMGFYYVALRYDPPTSDSDAAASEAVSAETIRISFDTPLPYYPYLEPSSGVAIENTEPRLLELWYVGSEPVVPVALRERDGQRAWVQPLQRGRLHRNAQTSLPVGVPGLEPLLPEGPLVVQTFQDQKRVRDGFGDVLFTFASAREPTPELAAKLEPLLGILDPALIPEREPSP